MVAFAVEGITSFSVAPVRFITFTGFSLFILGIFAGLYALWQKWSGHTMEGWTSIIISIWLLGGIQLVAIGTIGEYIGKIFTEVKARPRYAIDIDLFSKPMLEMRKQDPDIGKDFSVPDTFR